MTSGMFEFRRAVRAGMMVAVAGAALGGCVGQQPYDKMADANRSLTERNGELSRQVQELNTENELLQRDRTAKEAAIAELTRLYNDARLQLTGLGGRLTDLQGRLAGMTFGPVDAQTDQALAALAQQYPDLIKYDQSRGMLRFASDLAFNSGDDKVQAGAKASLAALAKVLSSGAATSYELFIVGHTDSQRISAGTSQRHPTNMHLSAHRAISVRADLSSMGVPANKMLVAGWGEHRPVTANSGNGNTPANRRVEIYLTGSTAGGSESPSTPATASVPLDAGDPPARQPDMNK
jgi:chemotaxis protein MotB